MAWQFERFDGAPYLNDYVQGKLKFQIMFPTDAPKLCLSNEPDYLARFQGQLPNDFYRMIKPHFSFPEWAIPCSEGYDLSFFDDNIIRELTSSVKDPEHPNVTYVTPKRVGDADYLDLHHIGSYGALRIPDIPIEVRISALALSDDIPLSARNSRPFYKNEAEMIDWNDFVDVVAGKFRESFVAYTNKRLNANKLRLEQVERLVTLVRDL